MKHISVFEVGEIVTDFYLLDNENVDIWVESDMSGTEKIRFHLINETCVEGDCELIGVI